MEMDKIMGIKSGIAVPHKMYNNWVDSITTLSEFKTANIWFTKCFSGSFLLRSVENVHVLITEAFDTMATNGMVSKHGVLQ